MQNLLWKKKVFFIKLIYLYKVVMRIKMPQCLFVRRILKMLPNQTTLLGIIIKLRILILTFWKYVMKSRYNLKCSYWLRYILKYMIMEIQGKRQHQYYTHSLLKQAKRTNWFYHSSKNIYYNYDKVQGRP